MGDSLLPDLEEANGMGPIVDELITAHQQSLGLRAVVLTATELSRRARDIHEAEAASGALLAQGLTAALLLAALQKETTRVSFQVECDGPLRGLFADADTEGKVRGYVKNRAVGFLGVDGAFHFRPALGNKGYLSVLRDLGGEFYRSAVDLEAFDLSRDLERYFQISEQVETRLELGCSAVPGEPLGQVFGVLVQKLPGGDLGKLDALARRVREALPKLAVEPPRSATQLVQLLLSEDGFEITSRLPLSYTCTCSLERVERALVSIGPSALREIIEEDKKAEVSCEFCTKRYELREAELRVLLGRAETGG